MSHEWRICRPPAGPDYYFHIPSGRVAWSVPPHINAASLLLFGSADEALVSDAQLVQPDEAAALAQAALHASGGGTPTATREAADARAAAASESRAPRSTAVAPRAREPPQHTPTHAAPEALASPEGAGSAAPPPSAQAASPRASARAAEAEAWSAAVCADGGGARVLPRTWTECTQLDAAACPALPMTMRLHASLAGPHEWRVSSAHSRGAQQWVRRRMPSTGSSLGEEYFVDVASGDQSWSAPPGFCDEQLAVEAAGGLEPLTAAAAAEGGSAVSALRMDDAHFTDLYAAMHAAAAAAASAHVGDGAAVRAYVSLEAWEVDVTPLHVALLRLHAWLQAASRDEGGGESPLCAPPSASADVHLLGRALAAALEPVAPVATATLAAGLLGTLLRINPFAQPLLVDVLQRTHGLSGLCARMLRVVRSALLGADVCAAVRSSVAGDAAALESSRPARDVLAATAVLQGMNTVLAVVLQWRAEGAAHAACAGPLESEQEGGFPAARFASALMRACSAEPHSSALTSAALLVLAHLHRLFEVCTLGCVAVECLPSADAHDVAAAIARRLPAATEEAVKEELVNSGGNISPITQAFAPAAAAAASAGGDAGDAEEVRMRVWSVSASSAIVQILNGDYARALEAGSPSQPSPTPGSVGSGCASPSATRAYAYSHTLFASALPSDTPAALSLMTSLLQFPPTSRILLSNDLRVLVEIVLRELVDLPVADVQRTFWLRLMKSILLFSQWEQSAPEGGCAKYRCDDVINVLSSLFDIATLDVPEVVRLTAGDVLGACRDVFEDV